MTCCLRLIFPVGMILIENLNALIQSGILFLRKSSSGSLIGHTILGFIFGAFTVINDQS
jgi:hypothetical protein